MNFPAGTCTNSFEKETPHEHQAVSFNFGLCFIICTGR